MSYGNYPPMDLSYSYSSSEDSFLSFSDPSTSFYCPIHNPMAPPPPPPVFCPVQPPFAFYFQTGFCQPPQQQQQVSFPPSPSSVFQPAVRNKRRFTADQIALLEHHFYKVDKYVTKVSIDDLATRTQLTPAQIRVWFNNKRTREQN